MAELSLYVEMNFIISRIQFGGIAGVAGVAGVAGAAGVAGGLGAVPGRLSSVLLDP